jgi:hypothetical protein
MATTTNYGWTTPDDTALVKDGAAAIRTLGSSVDTTTKALNPETTLGDLAYRSSTANVKTRLGLGTAGQVLQVNSGATAPEWATPASGGMTLISTTTLTGASITLSSIPSTYNNLQLVIRNYIPATDGTALCMRYNSDSATRYTFFGSDSGINSGTTTGYNSTYIQISSNNDNAVSQSLIVVNVYDYKNTVTWKTNDTRSLANDTTTTTSYKAYNSFGAYNQTGAITDITLLAVTGNLTSGSVLLYGVK